MLLKYLKKIKFNPKQKVLRKYDNPLSPDGGVVGLKGNLAPDGGIVKIAGLKKLLRELTIEDNKLRSIVSSIN